MTVVNTIYSINEQRSMGLLVFAGFVSLLAVLFVFILLLIKKLRGETLFPNTHIGAYYTSLLIANFIQSVGTIVSIRWMMTGVVAEGPLCFMQGGWKHAGNIAVALFALLISVHVFNVLFRRSEKSRVIKLATTAFMWSTVMVIVLVGPVLIEAQGMKEGKGEYFGPSGLWCWITSDYKVAQTVAEYPIMFISAFLSFIVYTLVFLRVRGNLVGHGLHTRFQWVPKSELWRLDLDRDEVDQAMFNVIKRMIWYPVAYTILIVPIALARFSAWAGHEVPAGVTILADFMFDLNGLVNAILLLVTRAVLPEYVNVSTFATKRLTRDLSNPKRLGVDPLILAPPTEAEIARMNTRSTTRSTVRGGTLHNASSMHRTATGDSMRSVNSVTPLVPNQHQYASTSKGRGLTVDIAAAQTLRS